MPNRKPPQLPTESLKNESGKKDHKCNFCEKIYNHASHLKAHIILIHEVAVTAIAALHTITLACVYVYAYFQDRYGLSKKISTQPSSMY